MKPLSIKRPNNRNEILLDASPDRPYEPANNKHPKPGSSRLTQLIAKSKIPKHSDFGEDVNSILIDIYYETQEETWTWIQILVGNSTSVEGIIQTAITKINMDLKSNTSTTDSSQYTKDSYNLLFFKKKTSSPNYDYPRLNKSSWLRDINKTSFCWVKTKALSGRSTQQLSSSMNHYTQIETNLMGDLAANPASNPLIYEHEVEMTGKDSGRCFKYCILF